MSENGASFNQKKTHKEIEVSSPLIGPKERSLSFIIRSWRREHRRNQTVKTRAWDRDFHSGWGQRELECFGEMSKASTSIKEVLRPTVVNILV